ncbi:MAG: histidine phosphatase family protein [Cytophagales bacterium]|nr:histidine phosphatase family protein [Cytophagales bacterium]
MSKTLYVMRHAEAESKGAFQKDIQRELTLAGKGQAAQMGKLLSQLIEAELGGLFSSSAVRARHTAQEVAAQLGLDEKQIVIDESLYHASVRIFLEFVNQLDDAFDQALIVAHNPTLPYFVEYVTNLSFSGMSPAGVVKLHFEMESWSWITGGSGHLVWYKAP